MKLNRENKILAGLAAAALILIGRLFVIQILDDSYKIDASNNSMVYTTIYPTRGIIYDRNGKILVGNKVAYDILVTPKEVSEFDTLALSMALDVPVDFIKEKMDGYYRNRRRIGYQSVVMMKQLPPETYMKFAEISYMFPGFRGQPRSIRQYPYNAGGNLLGYVSEVDSRYIESHEGEYKAGDYAGMTGIEATCEKYLKGEKGYKIYLRDSRNRIESSYRDGEMDKEAIPGKDIVTTIDAELQNYGQALMQNKVGSLVAIEPSSGEILALVSSPGIDVDVLADIGSNYSRIISDPNKPMFNRAVQASYPPGSVFKLVNALIGLQEGVVTPRTEYPCHMGYRYGNRKMGCHDHRSPLDMKESIMMSCNAYYCYVFRSILEDSGNGTVAQALDRWNDYVQSFGFGHKLGSDFPSELGGDIPDSRLYDRMYGEGRWKATNIISLSIGQGEIGCTPLHLANLCATMANRGYYYIPHMIKESDGVEIDRKYKERQYTMVDTSYFQTLVDGMYMAVNSGYGSGATAAVAAVDGLEICGKTGTAQNPHGDDNSVFICFAPKDNPKIAVAAYIEHGSFGARWAAPIASLLVEKYLSGEISGARKPLEKRMLEGKLLEKINDR